MPPNGKRGLQAALSAKYFQAEDTGLSPSVQLQWLREGQRLARLFLQTSERRHWLALVRHLFAMAERQNEARNFFSPRTFKSNHN
jgi:hypothetical protein